MTRDVGVQSTPQYLSSSSRSPASTPSIIERAKIKLQLHLIQMPKQNLRKRMRSKDSKCREIEKKTEQDREIQNTESESENMRCLQRSSGMENWWLPVGFLLNFPLLIAVSIQSLTHTTIRLE
ncbi:hypothetical protein HN51_044534 [Arachis hypogaea]